ncbi:hypothetical protein SSS_05400 [Sarcoptes scabiei]|uniref:Uncharacterized protein n=2 Tax=Sarcoptes scabiei TaxID=52283 RepID=A0A834VAT0_SARSC|nr:hypothetical protein SSS_05400 [Sarcoptes scabiei]
MSTRNFKPIGLNPDWLAMVSGQRMVRRPLASRVRFRSLLSSSKSETSSNSSSILLNQNNQSFVFPININKSNNFVINQIEISKLNSKIINDISYSNKSNINVILAQINSNHSSQIESHNGERSRDEEFASNFVDGGSDRNKTLSKKFNLDNKTSHSKRIKRHSLFWIFGIDNISTTTTHQPNHGTVSLSTTSPSPTIKTKATKPIVSAFPNRKRISIRSKNISDIFDDLEMESKVFKLHNRCSKGYVSFNNRSSKIDAHWNRNPQSDTQITFIPSRYKGFGIQWHNSQKFLCIDPHTKSIVAKDCFDWCFCSFIEEISDDYLMFALSSKPDWKLAFNNRGIPLSLESVAYRKKKRYLKCRHFSKIEDEIAVNSDENHQDLISKIDRNHLNDPHHSKENSIRTKRIKYSEDLSCDWKKTGEQIFDKELQKNPLFDCILSNYERWSSDIVGGGVIQPESLQMYRIQSSSSPVAKRIENLNQIDSMHSTQLNKTRCISKRKVEESSKIRHLTRKSRFNICSAG